MFGETEGSLLHRHDDFLVTWVIKRENAACSKHRHQLSGWEAEVQPVPGQEAGCGGRGGSGIQSLVLPKGRGESPRDGPASLKTTFPEEGVCC